MNTFLRLLRLEFVPGSADFGLLVLRIWLGATMLLLHGWGKLTTYSEAARKFADPLGVGAEFSMALAIFGEVVGSLLLILGLFTRLAALISATTMAVAFFLVHDMVLKGPGSGELALIYLAGFVTLFITGARRFSLDAAMGGGGGSARPKASSKE